MVLVRHDTFPVQIEENGQFYQYTCYGDSEDRGKYYVIPETPEYAIDPLTGGPKFVCYTFRGDAAISEEEGGFVVFTVKLPFPAKGSSRYEKIKQELISQTSLWADQQAKRIYNLIKEYGDTDEGWKKLQEDVWFIRYRVDEFRSVYNPAESYKQFLDLLANRQIKLAAVPYSSGKAELTIENAAESFFEKRVSPFSPSMLSDMETVCSVSLSRTGIAFFKQALWDGSAGAAGIIYTFTAESLLPPTTVSVKFNARETRSFVRNLQRNIWGQAKREELRESFYASESTDVKVLMRSKEGLSAEQALELEKELYDWGNQQLEEILSNQVGIDMTGDIGQRFKKNPDKVSEVLSNVRDIERTIEINRPREFSVYPQTQLPSIKSLVGADKEKDYFPDVNLDEEFFKKLTAKVQVDAQFKELGIFNVIVKLKHGEDSTPFMFNAANQGEVQEEVWYKDGIDTFTYEYTVNFEGESQTYESEPVEVKGNNYVKVGVGNAGILQTNVKQGDINWNLVDRAQVLFRYPDANVEERRILTEDIMHAEPFVKPIFKARDRSIEYRTKFFLKDGQEFTFAPDENGHPVEWASQFNPNIYIDDPFGGTRELELVAAGLDRKTEYIAATVTYSLPSIGYKATKNVTFVEGHAKEEWLVPLAAKGEKGTVTYSGLIQFRNGSSRQISGEISAENNLVQIGIQKEGVLDIIINAEEVDFENRIKSARVKCLYEDSENEISEKKSFSFRDEDEYDWSVDLKDYQHKEYKYQIALSHRNRDLGDGGKIYLPGPTQHDWTTTEMTQLDLVMLIPDDEELARRNNLAFVTVFHDGIDWDEVKQAKVTLIHGDEKKSFRFDEDDEGEPGEMFLAPMVATEPIQYRVELTMQDGEREYFPERDRDIWATLDESELYINDYISTDYGGNLEL
ncbi:MAG: hypothetical protein AAGD25_24495 [Cyanobacteria bacterium P01_F01_bin.150]